MILRWEKFPPSSKDKIMLPQFFWSSFDLAGTSPPHDGGQTSLPWGFLERAGPRAKRWVLLNLIIYPNRTILYLHPRRGKTLGRKV